MPAKPVRTMAVRIMKMIPDEVGMVGLAFLGLCTGIEFRDGHGVSVKTLQRNAFIFRELYAVCSLAYLLMIITSVVMR